MEVSFFFNKAQSASIRDVRESIDTMADLILSDMQQAAIIFQSFCENTNVLLSCKRTEIPKPLYSFISELLKRLRDKRIGTNFIHNFIKYLLRGLDAKLRNVRINSLLLIKHSIEHLETVSPKLWAFLKVKIGEKLFDKEASVRVQAVQIAERFQDAEVADGLPFSKLLKDLLRNDPSAEVRRSVLSTLAPTPKTLSSIVERAVDISASVRLLFVSSKLLTLDVFSMTLKQRVFLINALETERSEEVKKIFLQNIEIIFSESYNGQYELFVPSFFSLEGNESLGRIVLALMKNYEYTVPFDDEFLQRATPPLIFLMSLSLQHLEEEKGRDCVVLPDLEVMLKSLIDSSLSLCKTAWYPSSTTDSLFRVIGYYDIFHRSDRSVTLKSIFYLMGRVETLHERVVEALFALLARIDHGTGDCLKVIEKSLSGALSSLIICQHFFSFFGAGSGGSGSGRADALAEKLIKDCVLPNIESSDVTLRSLSLKSLFAYAANRSLFEEYREVFFAGLECPIPEIQSLSVDIVIDSISLSSSFLPPFLQILPTLRVSPVSLSKLLLSESFAPAARDPSPLLSILLPSFYSSSDQKDVQYLHVFFHEYFKLYPHLPLVVYDQVVSKVEKYKVLNDQVVHWSSPVTPASLLQTLSLLLEKSRSTRDRDLLRRYLDLLEKIYSSLPSSPSPTESEIREVIDLASSITKNIAGLLSDQENNTVKNILFEFISKDPTR